jgi:glycosyltransferase involved in cell wall biosynthesis
MMRPSIKILRVIPRYAPAWQYGGSVRFSYDLDAALVGRGFHITVYASDQIDERQRARSPHEQIHGIDIHRFPNPWNRLASRAPWLGLYPVGLERALHDDAGRFDLIHVTEARGAHVRWAFAAARTTGVPIVWSPLGALANGVGIRRPYRRGYDIVHHTRRLVREASALIAQSGHEADVFRQLGAQAAQIRVIGLGVDARSFRHLPVRGQFRRSLGIETGHPVVLFIGRLHPTKGLDVLLRASAIVRRTHANLQVILIGWDDGALHTVRRLCHSLGLQDSVRIHPPAFEIARIQAYVDADVFAMSSTVYEETSLAAMEALACGTSCVLTRQCEIPQLEAMGGGRITECEPESFAAGLLAVLGDPQQKARAQAARRVILASHTSEQAADAYAALVAQLVRGRVADAAPPALEAATAR